MNCQKSGLDTVGSSISIVDLLRNDDASIDDWSSILRSSIYRVFSNTRNTSNVSNASDASNASYTNKASNASKGRSQIIKMEI